MSKIRYLGRVSDYLRLDDATRAMLFMDLLEQLRLHLVITEIHGCDVSAELATDAGLGLDVADSRYANPGTAERYDGR